MSRRPDWQRAKARDRQREREAHVPPKRESMPVDRNSTAARKWGRTSWDRRL